MSKGRVRGMAQLRRHPLIVRTVVRQVAISTPCGPKRGTVVAFGNRGAMEAGFIRPDGGGNHVHVNIHTVRDSGLETLLEGQYVEYALASNPTGDGCRGVNIRVINGGMFDVGRSGAGKVIFYDPVRQIGILQPDPPDTCGNLCIFADTLDQLKIRYLTEGQRLAYEVRQRGLDRCAINLVFQ